MCPVLFLNDECGHFRSTKSSNDITNNDTMSYDEEVASYVPHAILVFLEVIRLEYFLREQYVTPLEYLFMICARVSKILLNFFNEIYCIVSHCGNP